MHTSRRASPSAKLIFKTKPLMGALTAALFICSAAQAASFGHSRIVSAPGQPLRIDVPVSQLSADDLRSLSVRAAPAAAWAEAGLTPPVDLGGLQARLADGFAPGSKVIEVRSSQTFDKPVADLLLDVRTASGQQRFQVSLLTHASPDAIRPAAAAYRGPSGAYEPAVGAWTGESSSRQRTAIRVKPGDTMFAIAKRHSVPGVTIYQMMIALQRANPQAFIQDNVNLVKAGSVLSMPDKAALTAISDREARRIFQKHAQAFALYRQRAARQTGVIAQEGDAAKGQISSGSMHEAEQPPAGPRDQLRLSASPADGAGVAASGATAAQGGQLPADSQSDDRVATKKGIQESEARVSQLEENVKNLNQALQSQGEAATNLLLEGAKGMGLALSGGASSTNGAAPDSAQAASAKAGTASPGRNSDANSTAGDSAGTGTVPKDSASSASGNVAASTGSASSSTAGSGPADSSAAGAGAAAARAAGSSAAGSREAGSSAAGSSAAGSSEASSAAVRSGAAGSGAAGSGAAGSGAPGSSAAAPSAAGAGSSAAGSAAAGSDTANSDSTSAAANSQAANPEAAGAGSGAVGNTGAKVSNNATGDIVGGEKPNVAPATGAAGTSPGNQAGQSPSGGVASPTSPSPLGSGPADKTLKDSAPTGSDRASEQTQSNSNKADQTVSWIQEHMLGVITGLLALIVLIIAWILRRANAAHDDDDHASPITEAMVKEKLDRINLDLAQPPTDDLKTYKR